MVRDEDVVAAIEEMFESILMTKLANMVAIDMREVQDRLKKKFGRTTADFPEKRLIEIINEGTDYGAYSHNHCIANFRSGVHYKIIYFEGKQKGCRYLVTEKLFD